MSIAAEIDDLELAMRNVLLTTRATAVCPFHQEVTIRVGDDAAETHAFYRARNIVKSDGAGGIMICWCRKSPRQLAARCRPRVSPLFGASLLFDLGYGWVQREPMVWGWLTSSSDVRRAGNLSNTGWTKNPTLARIPICP